MSNVHKYIADILGAPAKIERQAGTILDAVRASRLAHAEAAKPPETKIEEKPAEDKPAAEAVVDAIEAGAQAVAEVAPEPAAEPATEDKAKPIAFKAIASNDMGVVVGIGGAAGSPDKLDLDGEFLEKSDLVKMAYDFTSADKRVFKANHQDPIDAKLVESWVGAPIIQDGEGIRTLKADEKLTGDMTVIGIDIRKGNETHWFVGSKLPEELKAKASDVVGFSWGAGVVKTEV